MKFNAVPIKFSNDKIPVFAEPKKGQEDKQPYVKYGEENNYPEFLNTLFSRSAKHNSIITAKQLYISGQKLEFNTEGLEEKQIAKFKAYIDSPNPYETLYDIVKKVALDIELFGGAYVHVIYAKNKKDIAEIYHKDYTAVRSNKDNTEFYLSDNWLNEDGTENMKPEWVTVPAYGKEGAKEAILYVKEYRPNLKTYTIPGYIGAIPAIITDAEIANFHRAAIQNGFMGGTLLVFKNGIPSDEEMKTIERQLKKKFTGTDKANSLVIDFTDGDPNRTPEIIQLTGNDFDKRYEALNKTIQEEIFVGHKVTSPMLFGVRTEGQLGGRNEMATAFQLFQNTYITPKQIQIENVLSELFGWGERVNIKPVEPILPEFSESTLMQILNKDEMREIIGRKPLDVSISQTNDKINSLSPLVANSVLNNMTTNEKRAILGLSAIIGGDSLQPTQPTPVAAKFTAEQKDAIELTVFNKYGKKADEFEFVAFERDINNRQEFALTKNEKGIIDILIKSPETDYKGVAKLLGITEREAEKLMIDLAERGYLEEGKVTAKGKDLKLPDYAETFVMYKYDLRFGVEGPPILPNDRTRPFCEEMIRANRIYTREEINAIGEELGAIYGEPNYDVFTRRGGWYHDPASDVNYPFCRHVWKQGIYKKK